MYKIINGDCVDHIDMLEPNIHLTFLDPPFNQGKRYRYFNDSMKDADYWSLMADVCDKILLKTVDGGSIYFMQREKNAKHVIDVLQSSGWTIQNMIIWKKMTSAVPIKYGYGKHYQIIVFATNGKRPTTFNKLRIDYPLSSLQKIPRERGIFVTDVWDDIREMTSGYFAGDEPYRDSAGNRMHNQQSPVSLLLRIVLSSTLPGQTVLDPFCGTGTTIIVAEQLGRDSIGIEIDPDYVSLIERRLSCIRDIDTVDRYRDYYRYTADIDKIWR